MKYVGRLAVLAQAALMAGWVNAGTVTVNGLNCGSTVGNVTVSASGDINVTTNDTSSCAPGTSTPGGPFTVTVNRSGTGTRGVVTGPGIDCGSDCTESIASGGSIELTADEPTGTDTFAWSGCTSSSGLSCTISNITSNRSVTATYTAAGTTTTCPTGVTCVERLWPAIPQEKFSMKANGILAVKVQTTAAGVGGVLTTYITSDLNTAAQHVALSTAPGDFSPASSRCSDASQSTKVRWQQSGTDDRSCQIPANSTAWINVKFTNCTQASCVFYLKNN